MSETEKSLFLSLILQLAVYTVKRVLSERKDETTDEEVASEPGPNSFTHLFRIYPS